MKTNDSEGKVWAIGDVHGNLLGLQQCLERSGFDNERDTLISLGDTADGGLPLIAECVDELLNIKNLIAIKGNHDEWFEHWLLNPGSPHPDGWVQGGYNTANSYLNRIDRAGEITGARWSGYQTTLLPEDIEPAHTTFWTNLRKYYIDDKNRLFIHAGFIRDHLITYQPNDHNFWWDRNLAQDMMACSKGKLKTKNNFEHIFIGHTTTEVWKTDKPITKCGVTNLDTGGGGINGRVTIMNVNNLKEYYQSEKTIINYPEFTGR